MDQFGEILFHQWAVVHGSIALPSYVISEAWFLASPLPHTYAHLKFFNKRLFHFLKKFRLKCSSSLFFCCIWDTHYIFHWKKNQFLIKPANKLWILGQIPRSREREKSPVTRGLWRRFAGDWWGMGGGRQRKSCFQIMEISQEILHYAKASSLFYALLCLWGVFSLPSLQAACSVSISLLVSIL